MQVALFIRSPDWYQKLHFWILEGGGSEVRCREYVFVRRTGLRRALEISGGKGEVNVNGAKEFCCMSYYLRNYE